MGNVGADERAKARRARNGMLVGIVLLALSGYVFVTGWSIPRPEGWLTAPAMLPLFLGGSLFIMAGIVTFDTIKQGALHALFDFRSGEADSGRPLWRIASAVGAVGIFYFGLLRFLKFEIAAFPFLFVMMLLYWPQGRFIQRLVLALLLPFLLSGVFQGIFGIPLPGHGNLMQGFLYWLHHHGS